MTQLRLGNCNNCCMLPPLGQLPALKELYIGGLERVVSIGEEFFKGNDCASMVPFPSLEYLQFNYLASWEQWHSIDMEAFPKLRQLTISCCSKLVGNLPCQLHSLETLQILSCRLFSSCIPNCPKLQNLEIERSENVVWHEQELPPSLCKLKITGCRMMESMLVALSTHSHLQQLTIQNLSNISPPMLHLPPSLQQLMIKECKNVHFMMSSAAPLQNLQSVIVDDCNFVRFMSDDMEALLLNLRMLHIEGCDQMKAFPVGILVPSLRELHIQYSEKLFSRQVEWHLLSNITYLRISVCLYIKCFPEGYSLPTTLNTLELEGLMCLETLNCTGLQPLVYLQHLKIMHCPKLEELSGEKLPTSLRKLHFWECPLLEEKYQNKDEQLLCRISHIPLINLFQI